MSSTARRSTAAEVAKIADLESREVLLAKLAGALKALPTRAAGLFQAPLSQMARLAKALEEKKPAGDAPSTDEPMIGNMKKDEAPSDRAAAEAAEASADAPPKQQKLPPSRRSNYQ